MIEMPAACQEGAHELYGDEMYHRCVRCGWANDTPPICAHEWKKVPNVLSEVCVLCAEERRLPSNWDGRATEVSDADR